MESRKEVKGITFKFHMKPDHQVAAAARAGQKMEDGVEGKVAEEYLYELIHRSLVQVSNVSFEGKVQTCHVHDILRDVIIRKMKDLSFCYCVHEDSESIVVGKTRRLSISAGPNSFLKSANNSHFRAIHVFEKNGSLEHFMDKLCSRSRI
jgi:disease resistance protein RPM1